MRAIDLTGKTFGRLTVVGLLPYRTHGKRIWRCTCDCGGVTEATGSNLTTGNTVSCGCFRREITAATHTRHGYAGRPEYDAWMHLWARCNNLNNPSYPDYGGRGIRVDFVTFEDFIADIGSRPSERHTVDRIRNEGHYARGNVRWATRTEQANNRRPRSCYRKPAAK